MVLGFKVLELKGLGFEVLSPQCRVRAYPSFGCRASSRRTYSTMVQAPKKATQSGHFDGVVVS